VLELSYELTAFHVLGLLPGSFGTEWSPQEPADLICAARVCDYQSGLVADPLLSIAIMCVSPEFVIQSATTWRSNLDCSC
jgi:hypothetical protein